MVHVIDLEFQGVPQANAVFLVPTQDGPILVETGPYSHFPQLKAGVEALGYALEDIRKVFVTHIHLDHAGAAWALADHGADIYVHPFGQRHIQNPERLWSSAQRIYHDQMDTLWGEMRRIPATQVKVAGHGEEISIGEHLLKAWHTPGHAVHHIAWQLGTDIFAGDVAGVRIGSGIPVPPCPPPDIQIEDWQDSINLLHSLKPESLYLTHFGQVKRTGAHLFALEKRLLHWANWIRPFVEEQRKEAEIVPLFLEFVKQDLTENGLSPELIEVYEAANPSWMSIAGLFRYWQKRQEPGQ